MYPPSLPEIFLDSSKQLLRHFLSSILHLARGICVLTGLGFQLLICKLVSCTSWQFLTAVPLSIIVPTGPKPLSLIKLMHTLPFFFKAWDPLRKSNRKGIPGDYSKLPEQTSAILKQVCGAPFIQPLLPPHSQAGVRKSWDVGREIFVYMYFVQGNI